VGQAEVYPPSLTSLDVRIEKGDGKVERYAKG